MTKKEFALKAISPYYQNPSICGYENGRCVYLSSDGRKCVFGKYLLNPEEFADLAMNGDNVIFSFTEEILVPEARGILSPEEWRSLQEIHDHIAEYGKSDSTVTKSISNLNLFTLEELECYQNTL